MKAVVCGFFILGVVGILVFLGLNISFAGPSHERDFLRFHIRAHSDNAEDQRVKYYVKQRVVNELTPIFYNVNGKQDAMARLAKNIPLIEQIATNELLSRGFDYGATASVTSEHFPTRTYNVSNINLTLPAGDYNALIINLGSGLGRNWWCVIYPPLCFLGNSIGGEQGVRYRSVILSWFR